MGHAVPPPSRQTSLTTSDRQPGPFRTSLFRPLPTLPTSPSDRPSPPPAMPARLTITDRTKGRSCPAQNRSPLTYQTNQTYQANQTYRFSPSRTFLPSPNRQSMSPRQDKPDHTTPIRQTEPGLPVLTDQAGPIHATPDRHPMPHPNRFRRSGPNRALPCDSPSQSGPSHFGQSLPNQSDLPSRASPIRTAYPVPSPSRHAMPARHPNPRPPFRLAEPGPAHPTLSDNPSHTSPTGHARPSLSSQTCPTTTIQAQADIPHHSDFPCHSSPSDIPCRCTPVRLSIPCRSSPTFQASPNLLDMPGHPAPFLTYLPEADRSSQTVPTASCHLRHATSDQQTCPTQPFLPSPTALPNPTIQTYPNRLIGTFHFRPPPFKERKNMEATDADGSDWPPEGQPISRPKPKRGVFPRAPQNAKWEIPQNIEDCRERLMVLRTKAQDIQAQLEDKTFERDSTWEDWAKSARTAQTFTQSEIRYLKTWLAADAEKTRSAGSEWRANIDNRLISIENKVDKILRLMESPQ